MARKKSGKKKSGINRTIVISSLFLVMFLSVLVRWWDGRVSHRELTRDFRVEVLNGTGISGLAMETAIELRRMGVDVLLVDNAESFDFKETLILDRKDKTGLVNQFARLIGSPRILKQFSSQSMVDATLILGEDAKKPGIADRRGK